MVAVPFDQATVMFDTGKAVGLGNPCEHLCQRKAPPNKC